MTTTLDPLNINSRLQTWLSELIEARSEMSVSEQVRAVAAIARIQYVFMKLREEKHEPATTGTAVKQYEKAFAANSRRRKAVAGRKSADIVPLDSDDDELEY